MNLLIYLVEEAKELFLQVAKLCEEPEEKEQILALASDLDDNFYRHLIVHIVSTSGSKKVDFKVQSNLKI